MTLVRWTPAYRPARDLTTLQDEANRFIDSFFSSHAPRSGAAPFAPSVDIEETAEEFVLRADLPGMAQKDVKVSLLGDTLTIRGERKEEKSATQGALLRVERNSGMFERSFTLGSAVRSDGVKATYRDGVLEIRVPKAEEARLREIQVQAG
jgi:HSP20 family protein